MLRWRPANTKDAVLAMQGAIRQYPNSVDFRQCHYFSTDLDIAEALNKGVDELSAIDITQAFRDAGLRPDKEVYDIALGDRIGFFVPECFASDWG
jgi:hypothetical protein